MCQNRFIARCATPFKTHLLTASEVVGFLLSGPASVAVASSVETYFDKMIPHSDNIEGTCQSPLASSIQDTGAQCSICPVFRDILSIFYTF